MPGFVFLSRQVELLGVKIIEPVFLHNVLPVNWQRKKYTADTISFFRFIPFFFAWYKLAWDLASSYPASSGFSRPDTTLLWERNHCEQSLAFPSSMRVQVMTTTREFTQRRRRRQRERQKSNRFAQAKQQLCTCITLFCTSLCRRGRPQREIALFRVLSKDGNKRQLLSISFPELWCSPLEFNFKKNCQHLTN